MFAGIDVHKRSHAVALIDDRGGALGTLTVPNSPAGYRRLLDWLDERDADAAALAVSAPGRHVQHLEAGVFGSLCRRGVT